MEAQIEITDNWLVKKIQVRPEVAQFAIEMEMVLRENDHKSGWDEMSYHQLFGRIKQEFEELQREYILHAHSKDSMNRDGSAKGLTRMREEAIDIANFCMFFCHNYQPRAGQEHTYSAEALDALGEV